jgi:hypothetical protein
MDSVKVLTFLRNFILCAIGCAIIDNLLINFSQNYIYENVFLIKEVTFTFYNILLLCYDYGFYFYNSNFLWIILCFLHGQMHILSPAFNGIEVNTNYQPFFDYCVHGAQALTGILYHPNSPTILYLSIYFATTITFAGFMVAIDRSFLQTYLWLLFSFGGVFGTHYHMMLLNPMKKNSIFIASILIWTIPYLFYLFARLNMLAIFGLNDIPEYDKFINDCGLFRLWYFAFYIAQIITK